MAQNKRPAGLELELARRQVFSVAEGFFQSSVLFALLRLRLFEIIGEGRKPLAELADAVAARPETLARLLNAGVALQLLRSPDGESYEVTPACRAILLPEAGEDYLGDFIRNLDFFRSALADLDEAVRTSGPTVDPAWVLGADRTQTRKFARAMHNNAARRGKELAHYLDTAECRTLLDLGSGPGTYAFYLGLRNPGLKLHLADLPEVLAVAREIQAAYAVKNEVVYLPVDLRVELPPGSYDLVLVSNTLHMLGERASRSLLERLYHSVSRGGSLVVQAQFLQDNRQGDQWAVYMDLIQLCITAEGKNHTVDETRRWLEQAGFEEVTHHRMSVFNTNSFLRAHRR